jgi:phosphatidate cytidylyltransferase
MLDPSPSILSLVLFVVALISLVLDRIRSQADLPPSLRYLAALFGLLALADWVSFSVAIWIMALFAFFALREFFSLLDLRIADRWSIVGAYLAIPFMVWFIYTDWYGVFIISIPVYAFLVIPFLAALGGGDGRGIVYSIGAIDFGLFLFVYCMGHLGYLAFFSVRMTLLLVMAVAFCDILCRWLPLRHPLVRFVAGAIIVSAGAFLLSPWTGIPRAHSIALGIIIPLLVQAGHFTLKAIESDLGVRPDALEPGRGLVLDSLKAYLFTAPVVFHYLRWFLGWGDILR